MFTRKLFTIAIILLSFLAANDTNGQNITYVFNPPPTNGSYQPGQVVNVCITITNDNLGGANWLHGLVLNLGSGWAVSTISNVTTPNTQWGYFTSVTAQGFGNFVWGPGFYYDSNGDGNAGNNWGVSNPSYPLTFCFNITVGTVEPDGSYGCGGPGNPLNDSDISLGVQITGDGETGSWGPYYAPQPVSPSTTITIDCCDAEAGVSPGTLPICETGTFNLFDELGAPVDAGGTWSGPSGYIDPSTTGLGTFDPTTDPAGVYVYTVTGTDACESTSSITMEFITFGTVQNIADCSGTPSNIVPLVTNFVIPPGGTWTDPAGTPLVGDLVDPDVNPPGIYNYEWYDGGNCLTNLQVQVTFATGGAAGSPGTVDVCTSEIDCFQPFSGLEGNPTAGGNWIVYDNTGTIFLDFLPEWNKCLDMDAYVTFIANKAPNYYTGDFVFTYVLGAPPCSPAFVNVTAHIYEQVDAGLSTIASICVTDPPLLLTSLLDGTPDLDLEWEILTGGSGVISNLFNPAAYGVTYLVLQYSGGLEGTTCNDVSLLQLNILPVDADAGTDNTITVCQSDPGFEKIGELLGTPQTGGFWTDSNGDPSTSGFNPAAYAAGTYVFTYNIVSTCASDESYLTIIVDPTLDPGISGTLDICTNETNVALSGGLTGTPATGGSWTTSSGNSVPGGIVNGNSVTNGAVYTYTVGTPLCAQTSTVTINLIAAPNAGILTTAPQTYCNTDGSFNLMTLFTTNPSVMPSPGVAGWTGPGAGGPAVTSINPANGSSASGVYTYTIQDTGCGPASVSITITITDTPNAGTDGTLAVCPNGTGTVNLFTSLGGGAASGGTWTGPGGNPFSGSFNPATPDAAGVYTYTVGTTCTDQSTVTVSYTVLPNPGTSNTITVCAGDPAFDLIDEMGAGAVAGSWTFGGNATSGTFTPGTSTAGVYTNTVTAGTCPSVTATLTVNVNPLPNAGSDATVSFCETAGTVDLRSYLNGTPATGGVWTDAGGMTTANLLDVSTLCGNSFVYTYTVGTGTCSSSAVLSFDVICSPNAGSNGTLDLCSDNGTFSLFTGLNGTPDTGGSWTNSSGGVVSNPSAMNPASLGTGDTFTYSVNAVPCAAASADVVVTILPALTTANLDVSCTPSQTTYIVSFDISGGDGLYSSTGSSGTISGGVFTSSAINAGTPYSVTISDGSACGDITVSGVSPTCICPAAASFASGDATICIGSSTNIEIELGGGIDGNYGFEYSDGTNNVTVSNASDGQTFPVSPTVTTTYTLVSVTDGFCTNLISGSVTITVDPLNDAGNDVSLDYCGDGSTLVMVPAAGEPTGGTFSPASVVLLAANSGDVTYTMSGGQCPDDVAIYTVNIVAPLATANLDASCTPYQDSYIVSFEISGGDGSYNVSGITGSISSGIFTSIPIPAGTDYSATISDGSTCADITVSGISPTCVCPATASFTSGDATICIGSSTNLEINLGGGNNGDYELVYSDGTNNTTVPNASDGQTISVSPAVTTTYTLVSVTDGFCTNLISGSVTITVDPLNNAGNDVSLDYCGDGSTLVMVPAAGEPTGGTFSPASVLLLAANSGDVTYTMSGGQCPDDIAIYTLNIDEPLAATAQTTCAANQTEYTTAITITGGTPPYSIDGVGIIGSTFTSPAIAMGTDYSFSVDDSGVCDPVTVSGFSPNCNCPVNASFSTGNQTICIGSSVDIGLTLTGGTDPNYTVVYSAAGTAQPSLSGLSNGDVITVSPTTTTTYTLVSVTDGNCTGSVNGTVTITVNQLNDAGNDVSLDYCGSGTNLVLTPAPGEPSGGTFNPTSVNLSAANTGTVATYTMSAGICPQDVANYTINIDAPITTSVSTNCAPSQTQYEVTITISGGTPPYTVDGVTITGNSYTSPMITMGTGYNFVIGDAGICGDVTVSGGSPNCNCAVNASFSTGNQTICIGSSVDLGLNITGGNNGNYIVGYTANGTPLSVNNASDGEVITVSPTTTTTYILTSAEDNNCEGSVNGSVTITVEQLPNAGSDQTAQYCADGTTLTLAPAAGQPTGGSFTPPTVIKDVANSGVFVYNMPGNVCDDDQANYNINFIQELEATYTAVCSSNQLEYTVTITIVGGTPPYSVDGTAIFGNTFTEVLIFAGNPTYDYTISDSGPCADVVISEIAPDCNCIAQGSITGTQSICNGSGAEITFVGTGDAPFNITYTNSVSGATTSLYAINNGHVITVYPTVTTTYTLTSISDSYCDGVISGSPVTITVDNPVVISGVNENCNDTGEGYVTTFNYTGGVSPISFSPANTSSTPGVYTSPVFANGAGYSITVNDAGACPQQVISSTGHTCDCTSDAGTIPTAAFEVCYGESATVTTNGSNLDGNDALQYILHDGGSSSIGNIIATSADGTFAFNYGSMTPGAAYYITAVVGNNLGGGNVNLNGLCTSLSNAVQVVMNPLSTASISGGAMVCPGESVDLTITFTGQAPYDFVYAINGAEQAPNTVPTGNSFTLTVTQPGDYTLISVSDTNCNGSVSGSATVQNYATPTATLTGEPTVCEGSGDGPQVAFTGNGPWVLIYSIAGVEQPPVTTNFVTYTIPVETNGNYALVSVEGSYCSGTVSGSQNVTILDAPTASITGGGTVCAGDAATFDVSLTGTSPWTVQYTVDGIPQNPLMGITSGYSFESSVDGDYVLVSVTDANCNGEVLASQAALIVNPLPTATVTANKSTICIGEELQLGIDLEGVPPYTVTYVINGDTTTATGLYSDFTKTLSPQNPVTFEVLYVSDGSNPTCSSEIADYTYIDAVVLPNAPVLTNDTICAKNGPVTIGVNAAPGLTYSWSPETSLSSPNTSNTLFQPFLSGPVAKDFKYMLTATNGQCSATDTMIIRVDPGPQARFTYNPNPISSEDPTVFFKNTTIGGDNVIYFWEFDSLDTSNDLNPSYKFPDGINDSYTVTLTAIDPSTGCVDDYKDILKIKPEMLIYVPTAFTPDDDGKNDLWAPVLTNVDADNYKLSVYDRLGELVFTTTDVKQKWNGSKMNGGYYVEPGVYVWMIETKNQVSLEEVNMKGIVTVVR